MSNIKDVEDCSSPFPGNFVRVESLPTAGVAITGLVDLSASRISRGSVVGSDWMFCGSFMTSISI